MHKLRLIYKTKLLNLVKSSLAYMFTIAQHEQTINYLDLIDSSREITFIYAIDFVINLYLIFLINI